MTNPDLTHAQWRKASLSESAQGCVEVAFLSGSLVAVRDSKVPLKPAHIYPVAAWTVFQDHLRGVVPAAESRITVTITDTSVLLSDRAGTVEPHSYTHREWLFFLDGVLKREPQLCSAA
ncbi:DUF397 domain-containing protein [Streptomyces candidus]|uniref:DUF397 domain-containing protein n=1 Tax=Streptomyces candidus TaxID=67283 RepID=A0A7X0HKT3_9ACTN|nr:DUF397 domain-containing protein [Streptomyces candidus]MBB6439406.1 hypothetical protein [Streptomyces candidus]GHH54869.1 hypothetical protein GCM10018773_58520 [Streptomyces candidus]